MTGVQTCALPIFDIQENYTYSEHEYVAMNDWCIENIGYHTRTAYHMFEFKTEADLNKFVDFFGEGGNVIKDT